MERARTAFGLECDSWSRPTESTADLGKITCASRALAAVTVLFHVFGQVVTTATFSEPSQGDCFQQLLESARTVSSATQTLRSIEHDCPKRKPATQPTVGIDPMNSC